MPENQRTQRAEMVGLALAILLACVFFAVNLRLQIVKWQSFHVACFDYTNVAGIFEETLNGRFRFLDPTHVYAPILTPVFVPYFLLYVVFRSPITLMLTTAFCFASGVLLLYLVGRRLFHRPWWPLLFAFSLALNPIYDVSALSGFRIAATVIPAAMGAFLAYRLRHRGWFTACIVLMCASQINIVIGVFVLGLALWRTDRSAPFGRRTMLISAAWLLATFIAVAALGRATGIPFPSKITHLAAFGSSPGEIIHTILTRPGFLWEQISYHRNATLTLFLVPLVGLPLLGPVWLAGALPETLYVALSTYGTTNVDVRTAWAVRFSDPWFSFFNTGFITIIPFVYLAGVVGARRLGRWLSQRWPALNGRPVAVIAGVLFVLLTIFLHYQHTPGEYGPVPLSRQAVPADVVVTPHHRLARRVLNSLDPTKLYLLQESFYFQAYRIGDRDLVRANEYLQRPFDFLVFDEKSPCLLAGADVCRDKLQLALASPVFQVTYHEDGIYIFSRR